MASDIVYRNRTVPFLVILNDPWPILERHAIIRHVAETTRDSAIISLPWNTNPVCDLSNGPMSNDLE